MNYQRCYNGVRLLGDGPCLKNVERLDAGALPMILKMAECGLQVDLNHFAKLEAELERDLDRLTEQVKILTGHYCNLNSPQQVSELLFKKLELKQARPKLTSRGDESTGEEVLLAIQHDHEVVPVILEFKEYSKLLGTYVRPIPKLAKRTKFGVWRMYPNFKHTRVPSGRLACSDPNLLAMPNRTERGREIRKGFITDPGWVYVSVDESQIEMRIAAHCSRDANLISIYQNEEDVYSDFATAAFRLEDRRYKSESGKWKYPTVDPNDHRRPAKTCVLASIYDVSPPGLLEQMPIVCGNCGKVASKHIKSECRSGFSSFWTEPKCEDLLNAMYMRYPGILIDRKKNHAILRQKGYGYCMWGRLLHVASVRSIHPWIVRAGLREIGNFPYQSGAQGTIKLVMAQLYDDLDSGYCWEVIHPLLQVHDELVFECREDVAGELIDLTRTRFENCVRLEVPIKANGVTAPSWGLLEK